MITPAGKYLRKKRIDLNMTLSSMATQLGVSSSYLSAVEHGKKGLTLELIREIIVQLRLPAEESKSFIRLATISQPSITISLENQDDCIREICAEFAERFRYLSVENIAKIRELLTTIKAPASELP